jgi:hypothetical protein
MTKRHLDVAAPCRLCQYPTWGADEDGPVHPCCLFWIDTIQAGHPCPACVASRVAARARRLR